MNIVSNRIFLVDTCFLSHVRELYIELKYDLRPIINIFRWGFTDEVRFELEHRGMITQGVSFICSKDAFRIPVREEEIGKARAKYPTISHFDLADQTLIIAGLRDNCVILTDDGELFLECLALGIQVLRLPHFFLFLVKNYFIDKYKVFLTAINLLIKV